MADHNGTPQEVDLIIAGGGAAGGILAGRLAKADPNLEILLIESGINNRDLPQIVNPALYLSNLVPTSNTATFYEAKASDDLAGRKVIVPVGGCLGGGSSINFMMYTRAQAIDFEDWKMEGWGPKDLLPLLKKTEHFDIDIDDPAIDKSIHGYDGEFHVSRGTYEAKPFVRDWMSTVKSLGYKEVADAQNLVEGNAFTRWPKWINPETGARQDVPHSLLHPIVDAGNTKLKILTESKVTRVLFDENKRAVGVEYVPNKGKQVMTSLTADVTANSSPIVVRARKLVVISAGALGSPQILQRSGVGNRSKLSEVGISTVSEVNGVGTNYQDHHLLLVPYFSKAKPDETLDGLLSGRLPAEQAFKQKAASPSTSILGWNGIDIGSKLRPSLEDVKAMGLEVEDLWNRDFRDRPSRPLMLIAALSGFLGDHSTIPTGQYFTTGSYTAYPYSRGSVHITGKSVDDPVDFDVGILNHCADVTKLVWAYKKQREIARRLEHYAGALEVAHPKFPEGSKASFAYVDGKDKQTNGTDVIAGALGSIGVTNGSNGTNGESNKLDNIEYSREDDAAIEQFVRENVQTTWHSLGTCAMKPLEEGGTVNKDLNVYGVKGLKVADLSIPPENIAGNTYSTAMLIGEKAAVIIAKELGINYVV